MLIINLFRAGSTSRNVSSFAVGTAACKGEADCYVVVWYILRLMYLKKQSPYLSNCQRSKPLTNQQPPDSEVETVELWKDEVTTNPRVNKPP